MASLKPICPETTRMSALGHKYWERASPGKLLQPPQAD
jgi:hypothetical protein